MKPNQINIDGVLYDLTPAAAEPKGKEWEINCIQLGGRNRWLQKDGKYSSELFAPHVELDFLLSQPNRIIHSVRRLSDNEVFAVGEYVVTNNGRGRHKILAFTIIDGDMCADLEEFATQYEFLSKIQKPAARTPLFTTTDGEEISESQSLVLVFAVTPKWEIMECSAEFANLNTYKEKAGQEPLFKVFFHKQNAVDYIAENKPLYSLNDIQKALHGEWGTQNAVDNVLNRIRNSKK